MTPALRLATVLGCLLFAACTPPNGGPLPIPLEDASADGPASVDAAATGASDTGVPDAPALEPDTRPDSPAAIPDVAAATPDVPAAPDAPSPPPPPDAAPPSPDAPQLPPDAAPAPPPDAGPVCPTKSADNLVPNPGLDTAAGWYVENNDHGTWEAEDRFGCSGSGSLAPGFYGMSSICIPVVGGTAYNFGYWVKSAPLPGRPYCNLWWSDDASCSGSGHLLAKLYSYNGPGDGTWHPSDLPAPAPAGALSAKVTCYSGNSGTPGTDTGSLFDLFYLSATGSKF